MANLSKIVKERKKLKQRGTKGKKKKKVVVSKMESKEHFDPLAF